MAKKKGAAAKAGRQRKHDGKHHKQRDEASQEADHGACVPAPLAADHPSSSGPGDAAQQQQRVVTSAVVGLSNLGNTCFFNSSLQLLLACAPLQQLVLQPEHTICRGPLGYALQQATAFADGRSHARAVGSSSGGGHPTYNPQSLLSAVCCHAPVFRGKQQHDAHELVRMLLDGLQTQEQRLHGIAKRGSQQHQQQHLANGNADAATSTAGSDADSPGGAAASVNDQRGCDSSSSSSNCEDTDTAGLAASNGVSGHEASTAPLSSHDAQPGARSQQTSGSSSSSNSSTGADADPSSSTDPALSSAQQHPDSILPHDQQQQQTSNDAVGAPSSCPRCSACAAGAPEGGDSHQQESPLQQRLPVLQRKSLLPPEPPASAGSSSVDALFGGVLRSCVACSACGYCSISYEPFLDLSLPIPLAPQPAEQGARKGSLLSRLAGRGGGGKKKGASGAGAAASSPQAAAASATDAAAAAAEAASAAAAAAAAATAAAANPKTSHKEKRRLQQQAARAAKEAKQLARLAAKCKEEAGSAANGTPSSQDAQQKEQQQQQQQEAPAPDAIDENPVGDVGEPALARDEQQQASQGGGSSQPAPSAGARPPPALQVPTPRGESTDDGSIGSNWTDLGPINLSPPNSAVGCFGGAWPDQRSTSPAVAPLSSGGGGGGATHTPASNGRPAAGAAAGAAERPRTLHRRFSSLGSLSALTTGAKGGLTSLFGARHGRQGSRDGGLSVDTKPAAGEPVGAGLLSPGRLGGRGFLLGRQSTPPPPRPATALGIVSELGDAAAAAGGGGHARISIPEDAPISPPAGSVPHAGSSGSASPPPAPGSQPVPPAPSAFSDGTQLPLHQASDGGPGEAPAAFKVPPAAGRLQRALSDDSIMRMSSFQRTASIGSGAGCTDSPASAAAGADQLPPQHQQHAAAAAPTAGTAVAPLLDDNEQPGCEVPAATAAAANSTADQQQAAAEQAAAPGGQEAAGADSGLAAAAAPAADSFAAAAVVGPGEALAVSHCLAAFFVREEVGWECPAEKALWKERRLAVAAAHAATADGGPAVCSACGRQQQQLAGPPQEQPGALPIGLVAAHPRLQELQELRDSDGPVFKQVSFSEREPEVYCVPGSVEQRGTDLAAALAGRKPFCRPLSWGGASLLLTAQLGDPIASGAGAAQELRLGLKAAGEGGVANVAAARVLPFGREMQLARVQLPDVHALGLSGEDASALLQNWAQLVLNCMADLVHCEGGVPGLRSMLAGGLQLCRSLDSESGAAAPLRPGYVQDSAVQWRVRGHLPARPAGSRASAEQHQGAGSAGMPSSGYWEYPAGEDAAAAMPDTDACADAAAAAAAGNGNSSDSVPPDTPAAAAVDGGSSSDARAADGASMPAAAPGPQAAAEDDGMFDMDDEDGPPAALASQDEQGPAAQAAQGWQADADGGSSCGAAATGTASHSSSAALDLLSSRPGSSCSSSRALADDSNSSAATASEGRFRKVVQRPGAAGAAESPGSSSSSAGRSPPAALSPLSTANGTAPVTMPVAAAALARQGGAASSSPPLGCSPASAGAAGTPGSLRRSSLRRRSSTCDRTAHKAYRVHIAPQVLMLHLKRFQHDGRGRLTKLDTPVAFPFELDLLPFMAPSAPAQPQQPPHPAGGGVPSSNGHLDGGAAAAAPSPNGVSLLPPGGSGAEVHRQTQPAGPLMYDLVGLVVHSGTMRGGHYVAYVKRLLPPKPPTVGSSPRGGQPEQQQQQSAWYYCSDSVVRSVKQSEVAAAQAYLLMYVQRGTPAAAAAAAGGGSDTCSGQHQHQHQEASSSGHDSVEQEP